MHREQEGEMKMEREYRSHCIYSWFVFVLSFKL